MSLPRILVAATAVAGLAVPAFASNMAPSTVLKGAALEKQARVKLADARRIALAARAGTITDQELEKEKGGSGLRYSFDIKAAGKTYEVGVDARSGSVLENAADGKNPD